MKKIFCLFCLLALLTAGGITEEWPSGDWVLEQVDKNIGSDNKVSTSEMVIQGRRGSRTIKSKSWLQGIDKSFTEYLAPAREKGTKMLKLEDQLWIYMPSTDRIIKISGHMLRQSVMGSDLSYEDFMEDPELNKIYEAKVVAEDVFLERPCWVLELTSKGGDIAYHSRKIWVDKERFLSLKEERFAKSGKLLKTFTVMKVSRTQNRWIPMHVVFKDELKSGKGTEFFLESIELNANIPEHIFTKASLRK
ncbi:MAG: outer membrane lipoprotein-sorting protein [Candidatus Aminicenantes bacterium]|nr:MAG: outer membrane lipoprotein-sorting protein [Candidatus Aminicenantes bacterium]